jgi:hypothetical protein
LWSAETNADLRKAEHLAAIQNLESRGTMLIAIGSAEL